MACPCVCVSMHVEKHWMAIEWPRGCQEYDGERRYNGRANIYPYHVNTRLRKNVNNMISSCNIMAQRGKRETNEKECVVLCESSSSPSNFFVFFWPREKEEEKEEEEDINNANFQAKRWTCRLLWCYTHISLSLFFPLSLSSSSHQKGDFCTSPSAPSPSPSPLRKRRRKTKTKSKTKTNRRPPSSPLLHRLLSHLHGCHSPRTLACCVQSRPHPWDQLQTTSLQRPPVPESFHKSTESWFLLIF